jgi:hypothetical protein
MPVPDGKPHAVGGGSLGQVGEELRPCMLLPGVWLVTFAAGSCVDRPAAGIT